MYFRSPEVRALIFLSAQGAGQTTSETYFKQMANGPASSMQLPEVATHYSSVGAEEI